MRFVALPQPQRGWDEIDYALMNGDTEVGRVIHLMALRGWFWTTVKYHRLDDCIESDEIFPTAALAAHSLMEHVHGR